MMFLSDTDRAVVLEVLLTYLNSEGGVISAMAHSLMTDREEAMYRRLYLVRSTLQRAARDRRLTPKGRELLMTDPLAVWLEAEAKHLREKGVNV